MCYKVKRRNVSLVYVFTKIKTHLLQKKITKINNCVAVCTRMSVLIKNRYPNLFSNLIVAVTLTTICGKVFEVNFLLYSTVSRTNEKKKKLNCWLKSTRSLTHIRMYVRKFKIHGFRYVISILYCSAVLWKSVGWFFILCGYRPPWDRPKLLPFVFRRK